MSRTNFIQDCINSDALLEEIDNYIDDWHDGDSTDEIYDYLGMTQKEYRMWAENSTILKYIISAHMEKMDIEDVLSQEYSNSLKLVARADSPDEVKIMHSWLVKKGIIKE